VLLASQRWFGKSLNAPAALKRIATFLLVLVGWVLFRADSFTMARTLLRSMFFWAPGQAVVGWPLLTLLVSIAAVLAHCGPNTFELAHEWRPPMTYTLVLLFAACLFVIYGGHQSPFLYFQF
jgi:alginate O-acetyltransferase complex protein AlgI